MLHIVSLRLKHCLDSIFHAKEAMLMPSSISAQKDGHTICSFEIPGLRENTPYVEEDDIIEMRRLFIDRTGRPLGMAEWLAPGPLPGANYGFPVPGGRSRGEAAPGWTNVIYHARASVIQRKQGRLIARVFGLPPMIPGTFPQQSQSKFNVRFPVPMGRYLPMQQALSIVQDALAYTNERSRETVQVSISND
jgi:putative helicase MOV10L1/helicase MOV-10